MTDQHEYWEGVDLLDEHLHHPERFHRYVTTSDKTHINADSARHIAHKHGKTEQPCAKTEQIFQQNSQDQSPQGRTDRPVLILLILTNKQTKLNATTRTPTHSPWICGFWPKP